jgi:hypothetical protein
VNLVTSHNKHEADIHTYMYDISISWKIY